MNPDVVLFETHLLYCSHHLDEAQSCLARSPASFPPGLSDALDDLAEALARVRPALPAPDPELEF